MRDDKYYMVQNFSGQKHQKPDEAKYRDLRLQSSRRLLKDVHVVRSFVVFYWFFLRMVRATETDARSSSCL